MVSAVVLVASACGTTTSVESRDGLAGGGSDRTVGIPDDRLSPAATSADFSADPEAVGTSPTDKPTRSPVAGRRNTSPIKVGFIQSTSAGRTEETIGIESGGTLDGRSIGSALVNALNKHGGLNGRRIVKVDFEADFETNSFETNFQAACEYFSRDNKVDIVVKSHAYWSRSAEQCFSSHGIVHMAAGPYGADLVDLAAIPGFANGSGLSVNDRLTSLIETLADQRYLTPQTKVGFILENCPYNVRAWDRDINPVLTKRRLQFLKFEFTCATGNQDVGPAAAALQNAVLQFKAAGVTRVMMASNHEAVAWFLFAQMAQAQQYFPGYAMTSAAFPQVLVETENLPPDQAANVHGVGWMPTTDTGSAAQGDSQAQRRCLSLMREQGIKPQSAADHNALYLGCEMFFLLEASLLRTMGDSRVSALSRGVAELGAAFKSPATLTGSTYFSPGVTTGAATVAPFAFSESCSCVRYNGAPLRIR